jgi:hypothetical protein
MLVRWSEQGTESERASVCVWSAAKGCKGLLSRVEACQGILLFFRVRKVQLMQPRVPQEAASEMIPAVERVSRQIKSKA